MDGQGEERGEEMEAAEAGRKRLSVASVAGLCMVGELALLGACVGVAGELESAGFPKAAEWAMLVWWLSFGVPAFALWSAGTGKRR